MDERKNIKPLGGPQSTPPHPLDLPLRGKIPVIPGATNIFHTTRLCARLVQPKSEFDLTDPNGYLLSVEYNSLHDPNLRTYLHRKDINQRLIDGGFITRDEKVICSVRDMNRYRDHLVEVELDWGRRFRVEQKELVRRFLTLQEQGKLPSDVSMSDITEWLLQSGKALFRKQQSSNKSRFSVDLGVEQGDSVMKLPSIAKKSNAVEYSQSSTCRSELVWTAKGRQMLEDVTKEVQREMRLERRWLATQQEKDIKKRDKQQTMMPEKEQKRGKSPERQDNPDSTKDSNDQSFLPSYDDKQVTFGDLTGFNRPSSSSSPEKKPSISKVEPLGDVKRKLSAVCHDLVVAVTQRASSAHNLFTSNAVLVPELTSSTLATCGSLLEHAGSLQSITHQLSDIEQQLLEEHLKGVITQEELHTLLRSVMVTVVEEVNRVLVPAIIAFEYERVMACASSSDLPTCSIMSTSDSAHSSPISAGLRPSTPRVLVTYPTFTFSDTEIRTGTWTTTSPEESEGELPLASPSASLLLKVEGIIKQVIWGAVDTLETDGEANDQEETGESKACMEAKAEMDSKNTEAKLEDKPLMEIKGEGVNIDATVVVETNDAEVETGNEAEIRSPFEVEVEMPKTMEVNAKMEEKVQIEPKAEDIETKDHTGKTIAEKNDGNQVVTPRTEEAKMEVKEEHLEVKNSSRNVQAHKSQERCETITEGDVSGSTMAKKGSFISLLKSTTLSSDQVDEILEKVVCVLREEGHVIIPVLDELPGTSDELPGASGQVPISDELPGTSGQVPISDELPGTSDQVPASQEPRPTSQEPRPTCEPLCCVSGGQEHHVQRPGEEASGKLLGGQPVCLQSVSPLVNKDELLDGEIVPYANSIISVVMKKMQQDKDLHKLIREYKARSLSSRRQAGKSPNQESMPISESSCLDVLQRASFRSLSGINPHSMWVVRWLLQTIQRRHGWLAQVSTDPARVHSRQESRLLCEVIEALLEQLNRINVKENVSRRAVSHTDVLCRQMDHSGLSGCNNLPERVKLKLQEATMDPISEILVRLATNVQRPKSCLMPSKSWSLSPVGKSISLTDLRSHAVASATAADISSSVLEKLTKATGCSKVSCSMDTVANLQGFVSAMISSQPEHNQQVLPGSKIEQVFGEILKMVVGKLKSFITQETSRKPSDHLTGKMAESCLEVENVFREILQTLKSQGGAVEEAGEPAVNGMSTTISDVMFKHVSEGYFQQGNTKPAVAPSQSAAGLLQERFDKQASKFKTETDHTVVPKVTVDMLSSSSHVGNAGGVTNNNKWLELPCQDPPAERVPQILPSVSKATSSGSSPVSKLDQCPHKSRMSQSAMRLLHTTVGKLTRKLVDKSMSFPSLQSAKIQEIGQHKTADTESHQRLDAKSLRSLPAIEESRQPLLAQNTLSRDSLMDTLCDIMTKSIMGSLPLNGAFEVPARPVVAQGSNQNTVSADRAKEEHGTCIQIGPIQEDTIRQIAVKLPKAVFGSRVDARKARSTHSFQTAKRVNSAISLGTSRICICRRASEVAHSAICQVPHDDQSTPAPSSAASSNTSLAASDITEDIVCRLLL